MTIAQRFTDWILDGNATKVGPNKYREQTTQWKKVFTFEELQAFYVREYEEGEAEPLEQDFL